MGNTILASKVCGKCKQSKPESEFSKTQGRPRSSCKSCDKVYYDKNSTAKAAYRAEYYLKNKEKVLTNNLEWKNLNLDKYKLAVSGWYEKNRVAVLVYKQEWARINNQSIKAKKAAYFQSHKKELSQKSALWAKNNPEMRRAVVRRARAKNPQPYLLAVQNRRNKLRGKLSKNLVKRLMQLQKGKCACCNQPLSNGYHLDHIMPLALGGSNTDDNIQLLKPNCNLKKQAKHPIDFMQERGFLL